MLRSKGVKRGPTDIFFRYAQETAFEARAVARRATRGETLGCLFIEFGRENKANAHLAGMAKRRGLRAFFQVAKTKASLLYGLDESL